MRPGMNLGIVSGNLESYFSCLRGVVGGRISNGERECVDIL
jgi:hypothetical protein